eukprot:CCRYP_006435-RA/>CCRYP_006435-RA protein AED:0.37 eAED:0.41 QI:34/0/0/1/0/0/2/0/145
MDGRKCNRVQQLANQFRHTSRFSTTSKHEVTQRINVNSIALVPKIHGQFGTSDLMEWPLTIGMNETGGMNDVEFQEYILNSIIPLLPDPNNVNRKRVMIKVDSGPGRLQEDVLAEARTLADLLCILEYQTKQQVHKRQIKITVHL